MLITIYITGFTTNTMVSVARPWLICGYHGLIVTKCFFLFFYLYKTMVHFRKHEYDLMMS